MDIYLLFTAMYVLYFFRALRPGRVDDGFHWLESVCSYHPGLLLITLLFNQSWTRKNSDMDLLDIYHYFLAPRRISSAGERDLDECG